MDYTAEILIAAHSHCRSHEQELRASDTCGCFYCCKTCMVEEVVEWLAEEGGTAMCPHCGIDSVIGSASGFPVSDQGFLKAMHQRWFENRVNNDERQ